MPDAPVHVEIRGTTQLSRGMRTLSGNIDRAAASGFKSTADQVATMVRSRVPKRTGRLASSVQGLQATGGASVAMGDGVPYAGWIEFGGGHGRAYLATGRY